MDAKTDYPAACNAVEKVLVHESLFGPQLYKLQVCTLLLNVPRHQPSFWPARQCFACAFVILKQMLLSLAPLRVVMNRPSEVGARPLKLGVTYAMHRAARHDASLAGAGHLWRGLL